MDNDSESLLNVTSSHLNSGMRGIPVGTCRTSFVTPTEGVHYAGYPIAELMNFTPEQIFYLLLHKSLPTPEQTTSFMNELKSRGEVPREIIDVLLALPKHGHPMDWMSTGIMALGMFDQDENWTENGLNLVAKMPRLMGLIFRIREGRVQNIPDDDLSKNLVDRFIHTLEPETDTSVMAKIVSAFLVLHMDHGGGNLSTFTGKAIASGLATLYTSISGSMNALSGPLHGRANQSCLEFVKKIGTSDRNEIESFIRNELANKRPVFGFGHSVLRTEDPRATIQVQIGKELCPNDPLFNTVLGLLEVAPRILAENPRIANPNANVDIASGCLLNFAGFTNPDYYTTFFGWARVCGISAQIIDERTVLRSGKGVPIYRPKYIAEEQELRHVE